MTAYPKINGEHADTSRFLVHDVLRKEWGYDGVVISDWGGLNSTVGSTRATHRSRNARPSTEIRESTCNGRQVRAGVRGRACHTQCQENVDAS